MRMSPGAWAANDPTTTPISEPPNTELCPVGRVESVGLDPARSGQKNPTGPARNICYQIRAVGNRINLEFECVRSTSTPVWIIQAGRSSLRAFGISRRRSAKWRVLTVRGGLREFLSCGSELQNAAVAKTTDFQLPKVWNVPRNAGELAPRRPSPTETSAHHFISSSEQLSCFHTSWRRKKSSPPNCEFTPISRC